MRRGGGSVSAAPSGDRQRLLETDSAFRRPSAPSGDRQSQLFLSQHTLIRLRICLPRGTGVREAAPETLLPSDFFVHTVGLPLQTGHLPV